MKKILVVLFLILPMLTAMAQTSEAPKVQRTGYVDTDAILAQYSLAIKAKSDLEALASNWRKAIDSMYTALQNDYTDIQKKINTMKDAQKQEAQQRLVQKEQEMRSFQEAKFGTNGELSKKQEELFAPINQKIRTAIEKVAQELGYTFVFNKAGEVILLYGEPEYDITFKVLDVLKTMK
ncbi:MAG TPA: OmpH family outer membrane protein [Melioribacteraceae bacterium]|nr:OmpH family outer membrane protein [Melioribacteraceae bacterium]